MILDVKFEESNQLLNVRFGETYEVSDGGYDRGYDVGYEVGKEDGFDDGYDNGLEQGYNEGYAKGSFPIYYSHTISFFKVEFPENTELTLTFKKSSGGPAAFSTTKNLKTLKIICEEQSGTVDYSQFVRESEHLELLDLTESNTKIRSLSYFAMTCRMLKSILGELDLSECTNTALAFNVCISLEDIEFVPNTIKTSISFAYSNKLTDKSIQSIINGLADLTGQTSQTLDFHADIVTKLTDEQWVQITDKNWSAL